MNIPTKVRLNIPKLQENISLFVHDERDKYVSKTLLEQGVWEGFETQLMIERLKPGAVFIDVGANIGYFTVIAAYIIGDGGYIAAFEPDRDNFSLLLANLTANNMHYVDAVNAGLSDKAETGKLYLSHDNFGDHQVYDNGDSRSCAEITLLNGSDYLQSINAIDFLKIDVQGAEAHVIAGLLPLLLKSSSMNLTIIIEFSPFSLRQAGASAHQLLDMLAALKLPFHVIDHINYQLLPCSEQQLREWVDTVESKPNDEGFMNILLGQ
jgi:FkbM family methyltransferase